MIYIAIDGDNIGASVERFVILEQREQLAAFATSIKYAVEDIADALRKAGATIIFTGGDSVLAECANASVYPAIRKVLSEDQPMRFSAGVGHSIREAYIALKMAKTSGKGCLVSFDNLDCSEILRLKEAPND